MYREATNVEWSMELYMAQYNGQVWIACAFKHVQSIMDKFTKISVLIS